MVRETIANDGRRSLRWDSHWKLQRLPWLPTEETTLLELSLESGDVEVFLAVRLFSQFTPKALLTIYHSLPGSHSMGLD